MFTNSLRTIAARRLTTLRAPISARGISSTVARRTEDDPTKPNSFGHATKKAGETLEGGMDVQSAGVQAGFAQAKHGKDSQAEPYDTAAEDAGGQEAPSVQKDEALRDAKTDSQAAHSAGAFKDHRAGAQSSGEYAGEVGGKEEAAAPSFKSGVKQLLGMSVNKEEHQESKTGPGVSKQKFHTSARNSAPGGEDGQAYSGSKSTGDTMSEARKPKDTNVQGDQNSHLKHKQPGQAEGGAGNAGSTPHLPSKSRSGQTADDLRTDPASVRKAQFHTSARRSAPGEDGKAYSGSEATGNTKSDARKEKDAEGNKDRVTGGPGATPHLPSRSKAGQAADDLRVDPGSVRKAQFHTSARRGKDAAAGYVAATENPAKAAGYTDKQTNLYAYSNCETYHRIRILFADDQDTPGEPLPSADQYGHKLPPAGDLKPSSALPHSTTAQAPRHPVMGDQARDGTLADRNPPPLTSEAGEIGLDDAWKKRDAEVKSGSGKA
ncbi:hypothetical protein QFC24_006575 [Naganishia onofrii]|uniref:Uncharacterized protein n=1 Tax=Naganishia onofrii TaxID=1851511 RepID=A0ACC2X242_9TREE|nr:hypothetical protein QFC24_006575 [Naganishia onofrii]